MLNMVLRNQRCFSRDRFTTQILLRVTDQATRSFELRVPLYPKREKAIGSVSQRLVLCLPPWTALLNLFRLEKRDD